MNKRDKEVIQAQLDNEKAVLKQLERNYADALEEVNGRIAELMGRADADMQHVIYQVDYQRALKAQIQSSLNTLQANEFQTVSEYLTKCYDEGFLGAMYAMQGQGIPLVIPMNQEEIAAAVQHETNLSSGLYKAFDTADLQKKIASEISRGFSTGASYSDIARNVASYTGISKNNAKRIVRTEGHRITETAAHHAQQKAKDRGADVVKIWDAALDAKTRDSHVKVDGEIRDVNKKFSNGLMFPGDPSGKAAEVINCRCRARTEARWALDANQTKMLGDTSKMTPEQRESIAKKLGIPEDALDQYSGQIVPIKAKNYSDFKKQYNKLWNAEGSELKKQADARIAKMEAAKGGKKMAAQSQDNDWSTAKARDVSADEKRKVTQYAKERGIAIGDIDTFDGDTDLLKSEIDTISKTCKEYGIKSPITVSSKVLDDDGDFAQTEGRTITFNSKALRDRKTTEHNITNGNRFASKTVEDIALHETGHIIAEEKALNSIDIARKAYYNVTEKHAAPGRVRKYLAQEVSLYCAEDDVEIVAEVIVGNKNNPSDFTKAFVKLVKGERQNEST